MKKRITIHDIAQMAKVSPATVSRVLSNSDYPVSQELRDRVKKIAKEMNYIPNVLGKQLKTNASTTVGVIIPSIVNPFYSFVIYGIEEVARQHDHTVLICNSRHDSKLEQEYLRTIMEQQIKGLIISSISEDRSLLRSCIDSGVHVIAIDQIIEEENVSQIKFDYRKGGHMATKYLIEKGHRHIAYLTSKLDRYSRKSIYQGYLDAMEEAGLEPILEESKADSGHSVINEFDLGKKLARNVLKSNRVPTALFACNDMMAFGVINELSRLDIRVPEDMSVMGFDGIDFGMMLHPALTTIKQPDYEMGKMACKLLFDKIMGEETLPFDVVLQPQLVERQSVQSREAARSLA